MRLYSTFLISTLVLNFFYGFSQQVKITSSFLQNHSAYGYSISQDENYLIVGAKDEVINGVKTGAAYIYHVENGNWVEQTRLLPENGNDGEFFGISVSVSGVFALVGASGNDTNGTNSGVVYVYKKAETGWGLHQKLTPHSLKTFDEFGVSASISKNIIAVGAYSDDTNGLFAGAAYIYELENDSWTEKTKLLPEDVKREDKFGRSIDTDGKKVIIGSVLSDEQGIDSGSAYIFTKNKSGDWVKETKLLVADGEANDRFGRSVGIANEIAAVGAVLDNDNGNNSGSVYLFRNYSDGWDLQTKLTPSDGAAEDFFGYSLALTPSYLLVGAPNADVNALKSGAAYLFGQSNANWVQLEKLFAQDGTTLDNFGEAVHLDDTWISIGAPYQNTSVGAVYIKPAPLPLGIMSQAANVSFFPNPANQYLTINMPTNNAEIILLVYNNLGEVITKLAINPDENEWTIDVSLFEKGIYFFVIKTNNTIVREKVIIN